MNVVSHEGKIIAGLDPSKFTAFFQHKAVRILDVTEDRGPRRVFILLDASGSMSATRRFDFDVAEELLDRLPAGTQVGFLVFARKRTGTLQFTTDRESVRKQLVSLRDDRQLQKTIKRTTAVLSAINDGLEAFGSPQAGDSLYIISDGEDNASDVNWHKLAEQMVERGIRAFAMRVQWLRADMGGLENNLQDIVASTGGSSIVLPLDRLRYEEVTYSEPLRDSADKPTRRALQIDLQVRLIMEFSKMRIQLPEPAAKARNWELRFSDPKASKDVSLMYQHTLPPCPASTTSARTPN